MRERDELASPARETVPPPVDITVGMRVVVVNPANKDCSRALFLGAGEVTFVAERVEVVFDNGSGGMFPHRLIRPEPMSWAEVAEHLRFVGWTVEYKPHSEEGACLWRSPDGISGSGYRARNHDAPTESVMAEAARRGDIHFTHLRGSEVRATGDSVAGVGEG